MTDLNKIPVYRAKKLNNDRYVEGFYFAFPEVTYCITEDYINHPVEIIHCIVNHRQGDWGLPNEPKIYRIDIDTIEQIGEFNAQRKVYKDESWINYYKKMERIYNA